MNVIWQMPSAAETLKAEEAHLRVDWKELAITVEWFADAMIKTLVQLGPKYCGTCTEGKCCGSQYDPVEEEGSSEQADAYCRLARAIGVL